MRILYIITELDPGGAERVLYDLCANLKDCEVTVLAFDGSGEYASRLSAIGIPVVDLGLKSSGSFLLGLIRLRSFLKRNQFDIIHTHLFHANILTRLTSIGLKLNLVSSCHITERRKVPWRHLADRLTSRFNIREVCVSSAVREFQMQATGRGQSYFHVIYNGIDLEVFKPLPAQEKRLERRRLGIDEDRAVVGFLGRFDYQKGADLYLHAVEQLPPRGRAQFLIAGYGALEGELRQTSPDAVRFMGYQSSPEAFLQCLDICVVPSRWEGFGLVALEAMACGCAVIAADVDSLPEFIDNRVNGLLFEPHDSGSLAGALCELFNDKSLRETIIKNGVESAQNFSVAKMAEEHLALYCEILSGA